MGARTAIARFFPRAARRAVMRQARRLMARPGIHDVQFGDLRRTSPICDDWGYSRGTPVDRYYIDRFLSRHAGDVRGRVLEIGTNEYTRRHGGDRVTCSDVLHVADTKPPITIVGDLVSGSGLPSEQFDCAIVGQTLQFIYDIRAAVRTVHRILRPGGVALVTLPGITRISPEDMDRWGQYWSFTSRSARLLFEEAFAAEDVTVDTAGNVFAAAAFLYGVAAEELTDTELAHQDGHYEVLLGIRARKAPSTHAPAPAAGDATGVRGTDT